MYIMKKCKIQTDRQTDRQTDCLTLKKKTKTKKEKKG